MTTKTDNLGIWNSLEATDPEHTKGFKRAGGFSGTSINAMYAVKKMTEKFGPMGKGWGIEVANEKMVEAGEGEVLIFIQVALWWGEETPDGKRFKHVVGPQWGGDSVISKRRDGSLQKDDESFKKAMTDGMLKCMSYLGVGADLHLGLYDDNKYVAAMQREFDDNSTMPKPKKGADAAPAAGMNKMPPVDKDAEAKAEITKLQAETDNAWGLIQTLLMKKHQGSMEDAKKEAQLNAKLWVAGVDTSDKKAKLQATRVGQAKFLANLNEELGDK